MLEEIGLLILLTLLPFLELRASIPYGIFQSDIHWAGVFLICVATNTVLGPLVYFFIDKVLHIFLRIPMLNRMWEKLVVRTQEKIHPKVEKYGELGVALFIGVPLPGSGSYSGAIGSYLLGMSYKQFFIANTIGVLIAGVAVTAICFLLIGGNHAFLEFFVNR